MPKKTLTIHLAKHDVIEFVQVLSEAARDRLVRPTTRIVDAPDFADGARLFVFVGKESTPDWLRDLRVAFSIPGQIENSSSCAVLVFKAHDRIFVSTFAHGWTYLDEDNIEGDFGLKVAIKSGVDSTRYTRD